MKKILSLLVIIIALIFTGMQSANAQTYFSLKINTLCDDNCTTQEDCKYKFYWVLIDQCGEDDEIYCMDSTYVNCEYIQAGYTFNVQCEDCTDATHNPCFFVGGRVQKVCIGPGGSHVICEDTQVQYRTCDNLSQQGNTVLLFDF
jgi:hypothetical protein